MKTWNEIFIILRAKILNKTLGNVFRNPKSINKNEKRNLQKKRESAFYFLTYNFKRLVLQRKKI